MIMKTNKIFAAVLALVTLGGCGQVAEHTETIASTSAEKSYIINAEFDAYKKCTEYEGIGYYGYYDFLEFLQYANTSGINEDFDIKKDVDPMFVYEESEDGYSWPAIDEDSLAVNYYSNFNDNIRKSGEYMISDFKDGVCINRFLFDKKKYKDKNFTLEIPETLDGKPVLKLSGFVTDCDNPYDEYTQDGFLSDMPEEYSVDLKIPASVTDISNCALSTTSLYNDGEGGYDIKGGQINSITVDEDNPNFSSEDGILYSKNKEWLLKIPSGYNKVYTVPDSVKYIANTIVEYCGKTLTIGRNVRKIYSEFCDAKTVRVYKGSYADKWAKMNKDRIGEIEYID